MRSPRRGPDDIPDLRIVGEDLLECGGQAGELRGCIDRLEDFLHDRSAWLGEAEKLVIVAILVPATDGQAEAFIAHGNIPTPIFGDHSVRGDAFRGKLFDQILGEAFAPEAGIDLLLFAFVGRKFRGAGFDLSVHFVTNAGSAAEMSFHFSGRKLPTRAAAVGEAGLKGMASLRGALGTIAGRTD